MDWFSLIPVCRCPWIRLQLPLTAPTGPVWSVASVRSPTSPSKSQTGPHTGLFPFLLILSLECLSTSQEENGCYGAADFGRVETARQAADQLRWLRGHQHLCIQFPQRPCQVRKDPALGVRLRRGSPSRGAGCFHQRVSRRPLHQEQGNAVKLLARLLRAVSEAGATFACSPWRAAWRKTSYRKPPLSASAMRAAPRKSCALFSRRRSLSSPKSVENPAQAGTLRITEVPAPDRAVTAQDSTSLAGLLYLLPNNLFQAAAGEMTSICNLGCGEAGWESAWALLSTRSRYGQRRGGTASPLPYFGGLDGLLLLHRPPVRGLALPGRFPSAGLGHL